MKSGTRTLTALAIVGVLVMVLGIASGLGRAGVIDIEGEICVNILPGPEAKIKGGDMGGPYEVGLFIGEIPLTLAFIVCCANDPTVGELSYE